VALPGLETGIYEHLAWVVAWRRPHDGLVLAEEALNLSQQLESPIEVGRSLAARALASIGTRSKAEVLADLEASIEYIERAGFHSDALSPLMVKVFLSCIEGDLEAARTARRRIAHITEELHVDPGADALAAWWIESTSGEPEPSEELTLEWLDEVDAIRNRWIGVLTNRLTLMR
jgi:hypothetical protein